MGPLRHSEPYDLRTGGDPEPNIQSREHSVDLSELMPGEHFRPAFAFVFVGARPGLCSQVLHNQACWNAQSSERSGWNAPVVNRHALFSSVDVKGPSRTPSRLGGVSSGKIWKGLHLHKYCR